MFDIKENVQSLSDNLHDGLDDLDKLQMTQAAQLQQLLALRINGGMRAKEGQRAISRATKLISLADEMRKEHILLHLAAQSDAETMDWPFTCPENADGPMAETKQGENV